MGTNPPPHQPPRLADRQLFAVCVLVWGTTWHAITYQLGATTPEFGVAVRFALAGAAALAIAAWRGEALRLGFGAHAWLALQGVFLYGVSYVCVYHAERHVPSGLVAVAYAASPLLGGLGAALLFGAEMGLRAIVGGVLCVAGVALMFWTEFGKAGSGGSASLGAAFTIGSLLLSTVGSLAASRNRRRGLSIWTALGFGMLYGAASALAAAVAGGQPLALPDSPSWWASLLYLALAGSVLSFACYLALLDRLGTGPAGAVGAMTPLLALGVSMAFEDYRPDGLTAAGAVLAIAGNALVLRPPTRRPGLRDADRAGE